MSRLVFVLNGPNLNLLGGRQPHKREAFATTPSFRPKLINEKAA